MRKREGEEEEGGRSWRRKSNKGFRSGE